jgi:hypothetical protein
LKTYQGNELGAFSPLPGVSGNVQSSSASYASNASVKSGVPGRAPGMGLHQPGSGVTDKELPDVPHTDGKFMNEDFAREAGCVPSTILFQGALKLKILICTY